MGHCYFTLPLGKLGQQDY